ncbi:MAG: exo-alpha-sialidase [Armatimonadota bacterium]
MSAEMTLQACVCALLAAGLLGNAAGGAVKLADTTLFESSQETYRWSEGSTIVLDDEIGHLLMAVTVFGEGGHDNSEARILGFHSRDGGLTWTGLDKAVVLQENSGEENTMAPSLLRLDSGEILLFVNVKNSIRDCGPWVKRSADNGRTWGELQRLPYEGYGGLANDRALQLSSGRIVAPCWVSTDALESTHAYCMWSDDAGRTWHRSGLITTPEGSTGRKTDPAAEEPMIVELQDGRLMMFMRTYLGSIYRSFSEDGGETWSEPESSGIPSPGAMPTIKRMPTGDVLLIWNWAPVEQIEGPWPRSVISAAVSRDDGRNFTHLRHLDGAEDFGGKITMANVTFWRDRAIVTYSKSFSRKNAYNWRLQVLPLEWFYEGDASVTYGESYLPTLRAKLSESREESPPTIQRPTAEQRQAALAQWGGQYADEEGLVAAWDFEESGERFAFDLTGHGNDLFVPPSGPARGAEGREDSAIEMPGAGECLLAPDSASLRFPDNTFTVEAWVYPTAVKDHAIIATKEHVWEVGLLGGRLKCAVSCGGSWGPGWMGSTRIPLHEWSHVAVTFDGRRLRFFVDGDAVESHARQGALDVTADPLAVGGCTHIADSTFAGRIDSLRIWRTVRYHGEDEDAMLGTDLAPRRVDETHQLFIDDGLIASVTGLERVVNQPVRHHENPVLTWDRPWEGNCVITWGSVLYDAQRRLFRIWYEAYRKFAEPEERTLVCYAESEDGITWEKPELGLVEFRGSTDNNIVLAPGESTLDAPTVLRVPNAPPDRRYRMYWHSGADSGIRTATSPDGLHWTRSPDIVVEAGDRNTAYRDPETGRFEVITRIPGRGIRTCGLWTSEDGEHFEHVGEIVAPDERDPEETQLYGMIQFDYAGLRLGFLEMFFVPQRTLNTQLVYSRDGRQWRRACDRQTFLDMGPPGRWDQAWVTPSHNPPIRIGDRLYIFYQGRQTLHWADPPFGHIGSVGLAFLRPDGFVSMDAQNEEGSITTAPLLLAGEHLHLNVRARPGSVAVEVLDAEGGALPGLSREDCVPLTMEDTLDHIVRWKDGRDLGELRDQPVRLRFHLQGAKLYSFWMQ